ncbi:MAG TPA: S24 family peptidase [Thermoanaerobaculia bacterium]|jgi:SOS-response transcriptional repressor LexA
MKVPMPAAFRERGARQTARVLGHSLTMFGLTPGDRVFLKPAESARGVVGQIVLFRLNGELYLKRLTIVGDGQVRMENAHYDYDPLVIRKTDELQMLGEVVGCQRTVRAQTYRPLRVRTNHRRPS